MKLPQVIEAVFVLVVVVFGVLLAAHLFLGGAISSIARPPESYPPVVPSY